jgi:hypothetical protein
MSDSHVDEEGCARNVLGGDRWRGGGLETCAGEYVWLDGAKLAGAAVGGGGVGGKAGLG